MKKTTKGLIQATILPILLLVVSMTSCSKKDSIPDPIPPVHHDTVVIIPKPQGTVWSTKQSVQYGERDTINFNSFINTDSIWVNNVLMSTTSGFFVTNPLYTTTLFTVKAKGKGGVSNYSITVNVIDPNIDFLTTGEGFKQVAYRFKAPDSVSMIWIDIPTSGLECNTHKFQSNGTEKMTLGPCTTTPGVIVENIQYNFVYNPPSSQIGFLWHAVSYSNFTKVSETKFTIRRTGPVQIGSTVYPEGIIEESYAK